MKSQLYTRTGDTGTTSLVGGERIKKNSARLEAYGTVDELSSCLGAIAADKNCQPEVKGQIFAVQNTLFNIGSSLATLPGGNYTPDTDPVRPEMIQDLEGWIDALDEQTPRIRAFVLPGGCELAAKAHIARTICRRAERRILELADAETVDERIIRFINRLSDYLFILARYFNFMQGEKELIWQK